MPLNFYFNENVYNGKSLFAFQFIFCANERNYFVFTHFKTVIEKGTNTKDKNNLKRLKYTLQELKERNTTTAK